MLEVRGLARFCLLKSFQAIAGKEDFDLRVLSTVVLHLCKDASSTNRLVRNILLDFY